MSEGVVDEVPGARASPPSGGGSGRKRKPKPRGWSQSAEEAVERLNQRHGLVKVGDKVMVLEEEEPLPGALGSAAGGPAGGVEIRFLSVHAFRLWWGNEKHLVDGEPKALGDIWLEHPRRRQYRGVDFAPAGAPPDVYNLWRGWGIEPARPLANPEDHKASFATFDGHLLDNVCGGDARLQQWIYGWFAHLYQRPTERLGTALVLRGRQGTGKTTIGEVFGRPLATHFALVDDPRYLVGQFNAHLASTLLLQCDEGFWAGDKTAEGKLKGLVTSKTHFIERKGVDPVPVRNLIRLMVTSNNDWVVPAGMEERRFAVLDVGDGAMQDKAYFAKMWEELEQGGFEHLLAYLLAFDLDAVDLRTIPRTSALLEQKFASLDPVQAWWLDRLRDGTPTVPHQHWPNWVPAASLYGAYCAYAERLGVRRRQTDAQFGISLRRLLPEGCRRVKSWTTVVDSEGVPVRDQHGNDQQRRVWGYELPDLAEARRHFAGLLGQPIDWGEAEDGEGAP